MDTKELDLLIEKLKKLEGQDAETRERRVSLLASLERKAGHAAFRESLLLSYEEQKRKKLPKASKKLSVSRGDLADLYKFKPRGGRQDLKELIAQEICEILFEDIDDPSAIDGGTPLKASRLWPFELIRIYNIYKKMKLNGFEDPKVPSRWYFSKLPEPYRTEWIDDIDKGNVELSASIGSTLLHWIAKRRYEINFQAGSYSISLWRELDALHPPLTWGELMWHCVYYLNNLNRIERLKELEQYLTPDRHCITCGEIFGTSKYNRQVRCPRCNRNARAQRWRDRQQE